MPSVLKNLRIRTLGSVDYPANQEATVVLMKRDETEGAGAGGGTVESLPGLGEVVKSFFSQLIGEVMRSNTPPASTPGAGKESESMEFTEEVRKSLPEAARTYLDQLEKSAKESKDQVTTLTVKVAELEKNQKPAEEPRADELLKSASPEVQALFKQMQENVNASNAKLAAAEELAKRQKDEALTAEFIAKAKGYSHLPLDPKAFGSVLKRIADVNVTLSSEVEAVLKAADALAADGKVFEEVGSGAGEGDGKKSALEKLNSKAAEMVSKGTDGLTKEQAFVKACKENPDLYKEYLEEVE